MKKVIFHLLTIILAAQLAGCATIGQRLSLSNVYTHPDFARAGIRDLGVITFANESGTKKDISQAVTAQFIQELNKRGIYVIHLLSPQDLSCVDKVAKIDALLTGVIIEYRDYEPLKFGIKLLIKDLTTNETFWSAQEVFDSSRREVVGSIKHYYGGIVDRKHPLLGYKMYLISMNKFKEFCFNKIIDELIK